MEEIKLWEIDGSEIKPLASNDRLESEQLLEDALVAKPELLMEHLTLVGRQTPTEGGALDLLGVDGDGRLVVFELKRGTLAREAMAQIIDYASDLDAKTLPELAKHISERSGTGGIEIIDDFQDWYDQNYPELELKSLKPLRMVLIGLGVNDRTEQMVRFLAENSSMDISLLTFHGFEYGDKTILAKRVKDARSRLPSEDKMRLLHGRAQEYGVSDLFTAVVDMFREQWPSSTQHPGVYRLSLDLPPHDRPRNRRNVCAFIDTKADGTVRMGFNHRSIALCEDEFTRAMEIMPFIVWPNNADPFDYVSRAWTEIIFVLKTDSWETHEEHLAALVQAVYLAWQNRGQKLGAHFQIGRQARVGSVSGLGE